MLIVGRVAWSFGGDRLRHACFDLHDHHPCGLLARKTVRDPASGILAGLRARGRSPTCAMVEWVPAPNHGAIKHIGLLLLSNRVW